jgi:hypothetical protein
MMLRGSSSVDANRYADDLQRKVRLARKRDAAEGRSGNDSHTAKVLTDAAIEIGRTLASEKGGTPQQQRALAGQIANAVGEAMRSGDISRVTSIRRGLGLGRARVASVVEDCGCGSAEGEYNTVQVEEVPEELYGADGPDPRGDKIIRWSALLAPIGVPTGDGRTFAAGALTTRALPLPLRWHREDEGGHKSVIVVGTIDQVEYTDEGVYGGGILFNPDPEQLPRLAEDVAEARMLLEKGVLGPSVDLDDMEFNVREEEPVEGAPQSRPKIDVSRGRVSAATLVQIPAFAETAGVKVFEVDSHTHELADALTAAVHAEEPEELVDDPTWTPTQILGEMDLYEEPDALLASVCAWSGEVDGQTRHLFPIRRWVDGEPVVIRQAVQFALTALTREEETVVPVEERSALRGRLERLLEADSNAALVAGAAPVAPPAEWFADPRFKTLTPLTVTADGRVFGHLASWSTCHVGFPGACVTAPRSRSQYAYFHTGEVQTAEGELVPVGRITLGGGHADTSLGYQAAVAHYDDASTCVAYARAGEDEHGIWLAGSLAPDTDELKAAALRAHPPSGDWRRVGGALELMGAHAVNTPGFPVPRSRVASGAPQALVAAGYDHNAEAAVFEQENEAYRALDSVDAVRYAVSATLAEERARRSRAYAAVRALEDNTSAGLARQLRAHELAGVFGGMPAFLKKKIEDRKKAEGDDDEPKDGKKKGKKKAPFGGKQAPPFGRK